MCHFLYPPQPSSFVWKRNTWACTVQDATKDCKLRLPTLQSAPGWSFTDGRDRGCTPWLRPPITGAWAWHQHPGRARGQGQKQTWYQTHIWYCGFCSSFSLGYRPTLCLIFLSLQKDVRVHIGMCSPGQDIQYNCDAKENIIHQGRCRGVQRTACLRANLPITLHT